MPDLGGRVIAFLEGRRAAELADLIARHNGVPLAAPCLREVHAPDAAVLLDGIRGACAAGFDVAIFLTGVGAATLFESAAAAGLSESFRHRLDAAIVATRGPKTSAVLRKQGIRIDLAAPPPNTSAEVLQALESIDVTGKSVLVQLYGAPNPDLSQALAARGARVIELAPYIWDRPVDPGPILRLLDALDRGEVDALLVTSQAQVENLVSVAHDAGRKLRLDRCAIGAQGPVAAAALARHGHTVHFEPGHGHMGALVLAAAEFLSQGVLT